MRGILQKDLSAELPKIRVPQDATIPSVWEKRTDLNRCYISRVKNGHTVPSLETLEKFATRLRGSPLSAFL
jgi:transcriptional regulator with XRE-family HTH domain